MAELFPQQNKISFPQTLAAAQKFPVIGNRIFATLAEAQAYVDKAKGTAIPGIILSVISDGDNNGAYWVSQAAGYDGATVGILEKVGEGGGGITEITYNDVVNALEYTPLDSNEFTKENIQEELGISDWALAASKPSYTKSDVGLGNVDNLAADKYFTAMTSGTTNVISLTIGGVTKNITVATLKESLGLKALAFVENNWENIDGLEEKFGDYVLAEEYNSEINDANNGLAARVAKLEGWFELDSEGNIKTTYNFYSTKQIGSGGKSTGTHNLVNVVPELTEGTLIATINGTKLYAPESSEGGSNFWYSDDEGESVTNDFANTVVNNLICSDSIRLRQIYAPTSSGGYSYGCGSDGYVLKSNGSTVYWAEDESGSGSSYTLPLASSSTRGGIQTGFSESGVGGSYYNAAVKLSSEKAYVQITPSAIATALGYSPAMEGGNSAISLSNINGKTATVPNGVNTVVATASVLVNLKNVKPENTSMACVVYIVKEDSFALNIPISALSGIRLFNPSSGDVFSVATSVTGYTGIVLVWNPAASLWEGKFNY